MVKAKASKLVLDGYGSHLGVQKGCLTVKTKTGETADYPLFEREIGEVVLRSGNTVSTGALATMGFWGIDCVVLTRKGRPVAMLKSLDDDSHVKTRVAQYEAYHNGKAFQIAKQLVLARMEGQNRILEKYGLETHSPVLVNAVQDTKLNDMEAFRQRLTGIEGKCSMSYFKQIFRLIPAKLRPGGRRKFQAYDGVNNLFNLAYEMLSWRVYRAIINAKLEPFLGFLHAPKHERPSLVCDFVELYRFLIEDFLIQQCQELNKKDFTFKTEFVRGKMGKRQYLSDAKTMKFMTGLDQYFWTTLEVPRIYLGKQQTFETLINEEALQFSRYLRGTLKSWTPRTSCLK